MLESLNYSFRNPKNIIWVIYRIKQLRNYKKKNHGVLRGPQLGKQRRRARLGILRVNSSVDGKIRCCIARTHAHTQYSQTKRRNSALVIIRRFITDITGTPVTLISDSSVRFTSSQAASISPITGTCRYVVWRHVRLTNINCHDI